MNNATDLRTRRPWRSLVLNADYTPLTAWPLSVVPAQEALATVLRGRADVVEAWPDAFYRSPSQQIAVPKVVALRQYANVHASPKFCRRSILLRDGFKCFPAGTRVLMADGRQIAIEEVRVGDRVIDAYGNPQFIQAQGTRVADDCVSIKHRGSFERTVVTADHPFLDQDGRFTEIGKMEIAESRGGAYLTIPRRMQYEIAPASRIHVPEMLPKDTWFRVRGGRIYRSRKRTDRGLPLSVAQSPALAYLLGLYIAEGCATSNGVVSWNFCSDEEPTLAADAARILAEVLGLRPTLTVDEARHTCVVRVSSKSLAELLWVYCGKGARNKRTPWELVGPFHVAYLKGLFAGDAHIDNNRGKVVLSMTSTDAIFGAQSMLWGLGIHPTYQCIQVTGKLPAYTLVLSAANRTAFLRTVMQEDAPDAEEIFGNDTHVFRRLQERTLVEGDVVVYNIEVGGTNSYIANGLAVHNCQYCGEQFDARELTYDHVIPRAAGGKTTWDNILTACVSCNARKRAHLPNYSGRKGGGMRPLKAPRQPTAAELMRAGMKHIEKDVVEDFGSWLYWSGELTP